ncbi:hypothetical protein PR001_g26784 [Phytophthora rubi]|uniref:MULE transposase domain-containing protein n=1 Tax=Phytophthora rubi TaxID=129364 RepID=A0A6A3KN44_9STRA|nr:hypothetical protein PR001_g26784 [Phytophthora rubi]KAE9005203.1 hypothetical protein PR002_g16832 [Phytophthora rubi]
MVGRRLTRSVNNEETSALLEAVKPILKPDGNHPIYLMSKNANGVRGMVQTTFGNIVHVKQDPFHAMMRVREKIAVKAKKWCISKELMSVLYTVERELRQPQEMDVQIRRVASSIAPKE